MYRRTLQVFASLAGVAAITYFGRRVIPVNATTVGFLYLLLVLVIASTWGIVEAVVAAVAATLTYNFFFLPPLLTFTISDPENWIALFSFLATALIASRLSDRAKRRALDALERQQDVERLYSFSRAILLTSRESPLPDQFIRKLAEIFGLTAAVLYDRRSGTFHRAGPSDFEGLDDQLRDAAMHGTMFSDAAANRTITAVRLGSEPIASLALQGPGMPDSVVQGIGNLIAIGLERAKAQDLGHQVEVARKSEQLRTALIDAMAHEFKTPLTLIRGVTTSVLAGPDPLSPSTREQITIADEEAEHLRDLMDNAIEMARLDTAHIEVHLELAKPLELVQEVVKSMATQIDSRPLQITADEVVPPVPIDKRLVKLALKQLLDNALKYSPPDSAVTVGLRANGEFVFLEVTDRGVGISPSEQRRVFDRFYRSAAVREQIPGSGLGLAIALSISKAHHGDLTLTSRPGETTFRLVLPVHDEGGVRR